MDGSTPVTIENCFVRDVEFIISKDIEGGRIGGFVASATDWPQPPVYHNITNCYAVNVAFKGSGSSNWTLGYFAGPSDGGKFTNCYSGGVLNSGNFSAETFGRFNETNAQVNNCYSDGTDSGDIREPGHFKTRDTKVSTSDLKGMTGDVALGAEFAKAENNSNNYGYPQLLWELDESNQIDKFSAASFELTDNGSTAQVNVSGLKNNLADAIKPLLFIISYKNGRIAAINTKEIEMEAYDYEPDEIALSVDMSGADTVRAFMLKGADNVVPLLDSKEVKK